jgi:hypothetical protein
VVARTNLTRALTKYSYIRDDKEREREREREKKKFHLTTLSIAKLAPMRAGRNTSMEQWWNDNDRRNPKYSKTFYLYVMRDR